MMDIGTTATFALAFRVFAASPGPDNIAILSKTVNDGPAHGVAYGCGVVASIACFVVLAAVGLDALAGAVGDHLRLVRYLGSAYLVYTGVAMWRAPVTVAPRRPRRGRAARQGGAGPAPPHPRAEPRRRRTDGGSRRDRRCALTAMDEQIRQMGIDIDNP